MMDPHADSGIQAADQARAELYDTLGQLRDRLDYAQRIDNQMARVSHRIAEERRENPVGFAVGAVAVAAVVGVAAWGAVRLIARSFR